VLARDRRIAMKLTHPFLVKTGGFLGVAAMRAWMSTLQYKAFYVDPTADPIYADPRRQRLFLLWHEYMLMPIYLRGNSDYSLLVSRHRDAEIFSALAAQFGFELIRGSTNRGGVAALRQLLSQGRQTNLVITPDGPRGPRRQLAPGAIYLASRLELPIVLLGFGYDRPWRAKSWDRFAIPRPFSRARAVTGREIVIPRDIDREGLEEQRIIVERELNRLSDDAEAWAASGQRRDGQSNLRRERNCKLQKVNCKL
jgi:lysophospholipid acyltransferase (LPLAT)-like uncharacterized protein